MADQAKPECPRCEYDLSGEVSRWEDRCPIDGLCPECGLTFLWRDALNERYSNLPGFVEHAKGLRSFLLWSVVTLGWVLLPSRFWRRMRLHFYVRPKRATAWVVLIVLATTVVSNVMTCVQLRVEWSAVLTWGGWSRVSSPDYMSALLWPITPNRTVTVHSYQYAPRLNSPSALASAALVCTSLAAWPLLLMCVPTTRRVCKVSWEHVVRAAIYPVALLALIPLARAMFAIFETAWLGALLIENEHWGSPTGAWLLVKDSVCILPSNLVLIVLVWLGLWWMFAIAWGWRLRHAWIVWAMLQVAALLAASIAWSVVWAIAVRVVAHG